MSSLRIPKQCQEQNLCKIKWLQAVCSKRKDFSEKQDIPTLVRTRHFYFVEFPEFFDAIFSNSLKPFINLAIRMLGGGLFLAETKIPE